MRVAHWQRILRPQRCKEIFFWKRIYSNVTLRDERGKPLAPTYCFNSDSIDVNEHLRDLKLSNPLSHLQCLAPHKQLHTSVTLFSMIGRRSIFPAGPGYITSLAHHRC
jgi:hypothetical protein